jgi:MSHA pilin protein MshD
MNTRPSRFFAHGVTLVELIVSIVVIGVALAGVLIVIVRNLSASADPMIWHQSVAIAEAYLEEILAKNYGTPHALPDPGETRGTFDDVFDYNFLPDTVVRDQGGTAIGTLSQYRVSVQVSATTLNSATAALVQVTVTPPGGNGNVVISGYRTNN